MKKNQLGILQIENAVSEITNLTDWIKSKLGAVMIRSQLKDKGVHPKHSTERETQKFSSM